jgi:hypothetical protein
MLLKLQNSVWILPLLYFEVLRAAARYGLILHDVSKKKKKKKIRKKNTGLGYSNF